MGSLREVNSKNPHADITMNRDSQNHACYLWRLRGLSSCWNKSLPIEVGEEIS